MKRKQRIHNHLLPIQLSCVFLWLKDPKLYGILQPTLWGISMRFYLDYYPCSLNITCFIIIDTFRVSNINYIIFINVKLKGIFSMQRTRSIAIGNATYTTEEKVIDWSLTRCLTVGSMYPFSLGSSRENLGDVSAGLSRSI